MFVFDKLGKVEKFRFTTHLKVLGGGDPPQTDIAIALQTNYFIILLVI